MVSTTWNRIQKKWTHFVSVGSLFFGTFLILLANSRSVEEGSQLFSPDIVNADVPDGGGGEGGCGATAGSGTSGASSSASGGCGCGTDGGSGCGSDGGSASGGGSGAK